MDVSSSLYTKLMDSEENTVCSGGHGQRFLYQDFSTNQRRKFFFLNELIP